MAARPKKLFKVGEIMRHTGMSRETINYYAALGLISEEERTPSGHRLYGEDVFDRIETIRRLRGKKTLQQIREGLREK